MMKGGNSTHEANERKEQLRSRNPILDVVGEHVALTRKGNWVVGCCPFHEETNASFGIRAGSQYAQCWGCGWSGDVFKFVQDLKGISFPEAMKFLGGEIVAFQEKKVVHQPVKVMVKKPVTYYKTGELALSAIYQWPHLKGYECVQTYNYGGCIITRWEHPTKPKQFFPISHEEGIGWFVGRGKGKLGVYNQEAILTSFSETVIWVEGEKTANCAIGLGLVASTSAGGANGFNTTDFSALAGRRVLILPDNGPIQKRKDGTIIDVGMQYAQGVKALLLALHPKAKVEILRLQGLPDGGDLVDWVNARPNKSTIDLVTELRQEYKRNKE